MSDSESDTYEKKYNRLRNKYLGYNHLYHLETIKDPTYRLNSTKGIPQLLDCLHDSSSSTQTYMWPYSPCNSVAKFMFVPKKFDPKCVDQAIVQEMINKDN